MPAWPASCLPTWAIPGPTGSSSNVWAIRRRFCPTRIATLEATEQLVKEGFQVLVYTSDDPIMARRLKAAGAASVMPAGSPIGSGQGVLNPNNIRIILEYLKDGDPDYPVIVDAGVGTASDVTVAMELGCDGVLLNTGIAHAKDPLRMAWAMRYACEAGRLAFLAGRIPRKLYAQASSPMEGRIARRRGPVGDEDQDCSGYPAAVCPSLAAQLRSQPRAGFRHGSHPGNTWRAGGVSPLMP